MNREQSFVESIFAKKNDKEVYLKFKEVLDDLYEEAKNELKVIIEETIKAFDLENLNTIYENRFELEVDMIDKELYSDNFYNTEFGRELLSVMEEKVFKNEKLIEKISVLLPQAVRYYKFTYNE